MKKNYNLKRLKAKRSYSFNELAQTMGVHVRTVQGWHTDGLPVVPGASPSLVMGAAVKTFIQSRKAEKKVRLEKGQFYCLSCRKAVAGVDITSIMNQATIGQGKSFYTLRGKCSECGGVVNRFCAEANSDQS
jgi:hypothetical protein